MTDLITITGNLGAEPEQKILPGGVTVTNFRVGSTHRRFDKAAEKWVDSWTSWYQVSAYRALGENAFASLHKGDRVIVTGSLRVREWDNGTKRGLAVELEANAVGHDLLWGTSRFEKAARGQGADRTPAPPADYPDAGASDAVAQPTVAVTDAGGWAIPAATAETSNEPGSAQSVEPASPRSTQPELVDTPF